MQMTKGEAWRHAGRVDLSDGTDKGFVTRVLDGNFAGGETAGTAGTIGFRVALGDGEAGEVPTAGIAGDHLEITGDATGSVFFDVVDANGLSKGAGERIVLMTVDGKVDGFAPALANGTIEAGGYPYRLAVDTAAAGASVTAEGGALAGVSSDDAVTRYFLLGRQRGGRSCGFAQSRLLHRLCRGAGDVRLFDSRSSRNAPFDA